jgi:hypothetical protein
MSIETLIMKEEMKETIVMKKWTMVRVKVKVLDANNNDLINKLNYPISHNLFKS